jgi:bis(5'-adenosyl)-triphosphatase
MDLSDDELAEFMLFGRRVARLLARAFQTPAFNWTIQEREAAGQTVAHLHMHVIPRVARDLPRPGEWYPLLRQAEAEPIDSVSRHRLSRGEMGEMVARLRRTARDLDAV